MRDIYKYSLIQVDCLFTSDVVLTQEGIIYPVECQNVLVTLGPVLGAEYFVFDAETGICELRYSNIIKHSNKCNTMYIYRLSF